MKTITLASVLAASLAIVSGCGKSVDVEGTGMYMNANTGIIGIGDLEVVTNPEGAEGARIRYEESTAWLSPSVKTHNFKAQLYGSNACCSAKFIVRDICNAFAVSTNRVLTAR